MYFEKSKEVKCFPFSSNKTTKLEGLILDKINFPSFSFCKTSDKDLEFLMSGIISNLNFM